MTRIIIGTTPTITYTFKVVPVDSIVTAVLTIKERGDWKDPMFFAMSAYIYRIDEGLQFCIKAIQDFAYSGFGGRGGKHGDIFWDNESYAIKLSQRDSA